MHRAYLGHTWTHDRDWLIADIRDELASLLVAFANVNRAEGRPAIPAPDPAPRPGVEDTRAADEAAERAVHDRISRQLLSSGR